MTFHYQDGYLHAEQVSLQHIASAHGTPSFVYSRSLIEAAFDQLDRAFANRPHQICYAVKANSNLAILDILARCGAGFDIVSGGELARVVAAGCDPHRIIFSGVGKQVWEIDQALAAGIGCFNVESRSELDKLAERAAAEAAAYDAAAAQAQQLIAKGDVSISRAAGEDGEVEAVSAQDVQQVLGLDSSAKVTLPKMDGFGDYTVTVTLHKQVKVELPLKLVEA